MKVAVIGGGSTYTPELVSGLSRERDRLGLTEFALHDISEERRQVVGGMARRMLAAQGFNGELVITGDREQALEGADFVLIQIRVGGQEARLRDETLPLECDCLGQETTGAGGLAKAMRTVPVVLGIAERARVLANPGAWIVDFTNPVGIVTRALLDAGHRAVGLCNVSISLQRTLAGMLEVDPGRVSINSVGLNHLSWVREVHLDGEDVLPMILERSGADLAQRVGSPVEALRELGAIPSYYLRYFYRHDEVVAEEKVGRPRASVVAEVEANLLEMYRDETLVEKPALLERRGGAYYSEAAIGLMTSLTTGDGQTHVVDIRNQGTLQGLADDDVVEVPARIGADGPEPLEQGPLPPEMLGLIQHVTAYERLAARAAATGDLATARRAMLTHPLIGQYALVDALAEKMFGDYRAPDGGAGIEA